MASQFILLMTECFQGSISQNPELGDQVEFFLAVPKDSRRLLALEEHFQLFFL
jgi:hypothetical protein